MQLNPSQQTALLGALSGGMASFFVFYFMNVLLPWSRRFRSTNRLDIQPQIGHDYNISCIVRNRGFWTLKNVIAYLKIEYENEDVVETPNAYITPQKYIPPEFAQVCWMIRTKKDPDPTYNSVNSGEGQGLLVGRVLPEHIAIASESLDNARIVLKKKKYSGELSVHSDNTAARRFQVTIDPNSEAEKVIAITPINSWYSYRLDIVMDIIVGIFFLFLIFTGISVLSAM